MEGAEGVSKPRLCSTCKRAVKGHPGPYGPQCQNLPAPLTDENISRPEGRDTHPPSTRKERLDSSMQKERIDSQPSLPPSNEEFNDLLFKINDLLREKRSGHQDRAIPSRSPSLPYFAEHVPISNELYRSAIEGNFIDLNRFAHTSEESEPAINAALSDNQSKRKRNITTFQTWLGAWNIYEAILIQYDPALYRPCAEYRHFILDCSNKYHWSAVSQFDAKFRIKLASRRSFDFGDIDHTLFILTFDSSTVKKKGACFRCKSMDHLVGSCPFQEEKREQNSNSGWNNLPTSFHQGKEICNKFQFAQCVYPQCRRAHVCRICRGPMPYSRCNTCQPRPQS